ncbi:MAG: hypothetical protein DMD60_02895 [Gemmatimonadetes bacterium]|nr:MAG: hypothetical protein DMD60_02895 [Gemmatimonadota bacterium]
MRVGVDQPRDDRFSDEGHDARAARHRDLIHPGDRLNVPLFHENERVAHGFAARSVDEHRSLERDHAVAGGAAAGERDQQQEAGMRDAGCAMRHLGSDDVWS